MVEISTKKNTKLSLPRRLFSVVGGCFHGVPDLRYLEVAGHDNGGGGVVDIVTSPSKTIGKKPGGWKAMPYILGNETFERLATFGLLANFMVYLMRVYHMELVDATNVLNVWIGVTNFAPLIGAFISDAKYGRFRTIAVASFSSLMGMVMLTLTALLPTLHPPPCSPEQQHIYGECRGPTAPQVAFMVIALGFLSVGAGGIRPCSIPFGVDQFDPSTEEGQKGINSFYNWYYTSFTVVLLITQTIVVYIQDSVSWSWGLGIPTFLMFCSIMLFFVGTRIYVHVEPEGSLFTGIVQVFVAAYRKHKVKLPPRGEVAAGVFYDPPMVKEQSALVAKLPRTDKYRTLNKASIVIEGDLNHDGSPKNKWSLTTVQRVEEVKCLLKIGPVWASGIISFTSILQQGTFTISQAMTMDRHLGPHFQIPPGSFSVISLLTIGLWLPFYDRVVVPTFRKVTGLDGGITQLQRIGTGIIFSVLAMVVAGMVERDRRDSANAHPGALPMSALWLAPQLILMGLCEAFNIIGQIEFYNTEFPYHMRSIANALFFCSFAGASYLCTFIVNVVHHVTGGHGRPDWLTNDLNKGRLDYYYFLLAAMGALNFGYFLYSAIRYRYKGSREESKSNHATTGSEFELTSSAKV